MKRFILVILLIIHPSNGRCPKATFEFKNQTKLASYNFIDSSIGNIGSLETCPYTGRPYVYLPCYPNSSWGHEPYFSNCFNPANMKEQTKIIIFDDNPYQNLTIEQLAKLPIITSHEISNVLSYLNDETTNFKSSYDIALVVNIINRIIMNNQNTDDIQSTLYSIANKLLSLESTLQIQEAQKMNRSIVKLLSLLETYSQNFIFDELEKSFIKTNLAVSIVNRPNSWMKPIIGFSFDSIKNETQSISFEPNHENSTFIILDSQIIMKQNRLIFSVYNQKMILFDDKQYRLLTRIISLTIDKPELIKTMGSFVKIHFFIENNFNEKNLRLICAYWNIFNNMTIQWSTQGCNLSNVTERSVTCICNHLTHFAVLMDIEQKPIPEYIEQILSIITLTGLLLSSIGLCLTILTFIFFKKLRRHFSQKSLLFLSINLLCVNILFSIICLYKLNQLKHLLCIIIASLLHYFILSSYSWMFIIALIQYLLFVKAFPNSFSAFTRKAAAFSQIIPLIPVVIILVLDPLNYTQRTDQICWLSSLPFYLSFVLPIILYILINSILYSIVAYALLCNKKGQNMRSTQIIESQRLSRFSIALCCFIVLSLTWIFGLFTIGSIRILYQIFFCISASLTGFSIFLLHIITSKTRRTSWNNTFKTLGISTIYSPSSSSSSGFLGNKEFSTTSRSDQQKVSSRHIQYSSKPQHFIDAYMPSSPPPPAPPVLPPPPPPLLMEGDDSLCTTNMTNLCYEPRHVWAPETNYIYETNQLTTSLDDYSLFYASNHDATKL
ncbi:unnamed protein product [Rotaria sordida]|uniref:Uncharacterized protein n=1 Tax=Rotaria sordida TaxID=392033 RepID=A0A818M3Z9_9BILA|nr:unnamed protein product [Rotaria sordida]